MRHPDQSFRAKLRRKLAYRRHNQRIAQRAALEATFLETCEPVIARGPFAGMRYATAAHCSTLAPKLLGSYELELQPTILALIAEKFELVIDVGAAEGYYAVGFARAMPASRIIAFEAESRARASLTSLAELNGVGGRIEIEGTASPESLSKLPLSHSLVFVDVEGYEGELLDPERVPGLREATIVVEIHEMFVPGLTNHLKERFESTHSVELIQPSPRDPLNYPELAAMPEPQARLLLDEMRDPTGEGWCFGVFRPRS